MLERLQQKKFPPLDQSETSSIIRKCWYGSFDTIKQLLAAIMALEEGKKQTARAMSAAVIRKQQRVCTVGRQRHSQQDTSPLYSSSQNLIPSKCKENSETFPHCVFFLEVIRVLCSRQALMHSSCPLCGHHAVEAAQGKVSRGFLQATRDQV